MVIVIGAFFFFGLALAFKSSIGVALICFLLAIIAGHLNDIKKKF